MYFRTYASMIEVDLSAHPELLVVPREQRPVFAKLAAAIRKLFGK
jgi:hypothetical protein